MYRIRWYLKNRPLLRTFLALILTVIVVVGAISTYILYLDRNEFLPAMHFHTVNHPDGRVYILGSFRAATDRDVRRVYPLQKKIVNKLGESRVLLLENPSVLKEHNLEDALTDENFAYPPEVLARLQKVVQTYSPELKGSSANLDPWTAYEGLQDIYRSARGLKRENGMDFNFLLYVRFKGKRLQFLESMEEDQERLKSVSVDRMYSLIDDVCSAILTGGELDFSVRDMWIDRQTIDQTAEEIDKRVQTDEWYQKMILEKNRDWANDIAQIAREKDRIFVVVGVMHLLGEQSLLAFLDQELNP